MRKQLFFPFLFLVLFSLICTKTFAQIAPAPRLRQDNITSILEKGGQFTSFIRLLKATRVADQLNNQLSIPNPNDGLTIFAPSDNAFSGLNPGTLNSLSDREKLQLVQFHILPTLMSTSQFQTAGNPLRTQAGDVKSGNFPLNVTTASGNQVNITTGVVNATVTNTVFSDRRIAVYQVDQVLLPLQIFGPTPAPAPAPAKPEKDVPVSTPKASKSDADSGSSGAMSLKLHPMAFVSFGFALFGAIFSSL
ncbi:hypothetical protein REPUB_Repub02eG0247600 [Reevesia pubescens]